MALGNLVRSQTTHPVSAVSFRTATEGDAAALAGFAERCFRTTFGSLLRAEDIDAHCSLTFGPPHQRRELLDPARATILGLADGEIAAYVQLHSGPTPSMVIGPDPIEILRFYVDSRFHGTGLAQSLMARALAAAQERGARTVHLLVLNRNPRAVAFYAKEGFVCVGQLPWEATTPPEIDDVMARRIG
jgi:ribosomal protein S18 acetylase RimI-like enzyme